MSIAHGASKRGWEEGSIVCAVLHLALLQAAGMDLEAIVFR